MSEFVVASLRLSQLLLRDKTAWREKTKQAFDKLDTNGDGFIDFQEFVTACVSRKKMTNQKEIRTVF